MQLRRLGRDDIVRVGADLNDVLVLRACRGQLAVIGRAEVVVRSLMLDRGGIDVVVRALKLDRGRIVVTVVVGDGMVCSLKLDRGSLR